MPARLRTASIALAATLGLAVWTPAARAECAGADLPITAENVPQVRAAVLCLVDEERAKRGKQLLPRNDILGRTAQDHAEDIAARGPFAHTDADGKDTDQRARERGYDGFAGENLAGGSTAREAVDLLMSDPPHRDSLIGDDWNEVGAGAAPAGPASEFPVVSIVLGIPQGTGGGTGGGGTGGGGTPEDENFRSDKPVLSLAPLERYRGRVLLRGFLNYTRTGIKVTLRIKRGRRTVTRTVRTEPDGWFNTSAKPPRGSGRIYVTAVVTVGGKKLVKRRSLR